jgi:putative heavy-metal-binding protein
LVGGELKGMTANLINSRNEVMGRMIDEARNRGANAVVAMRFDTSEMGETWTELCAYGTAVVAVPITDAARETASRLGYSQGGASRPPEQQPSAPTQPAPIQ